MTRQDKDKIVFKGLVDAFIGCPTTIGGDSDVESVDLEEDLHGFELHNPDSNDKCDKSPEATRDLCGLLMTRCNAVEEQVSGHADDDKANDVTDTGHSADPEVLHRSTSFLKHSSVTRELMTEKLLAILVMLDIIRWMQ